MESPSQGHETIAIFSEWQVTRELLVSCRIRTKDCSIGRVLGENLRGPAGPNLLCWSVQEYRMDVGIKSINSQILGGVLARYISQTIKIATKLLWNANRNSYVIYRMVPFPVTSNDP